MSIFGPEHIPPPPCPRCSGPTFWKTGGPHGPFFSCIRYPACPGLVTYERAERIEGENIGAYDGDDIDSPWEAFLYDVGDRD